MIRIQFAVVSASLPLSHSHRNIEREWHLQDRAGPASDWSGFQRHRGMVREISAQRTPDNGNVNILVGDGLNNVSARILF